MEVTKNIPTDVVVGHRCDVCKKFLKHHEAVSDPYYDDVATLSGTFGYGSSKDMEHHTCHLCESCYDKVREFIEVVLGGKVQVQSHLFSGETIGDTQKAIRYEDMEKEAC